MQEHGGDVSAGDAPGILTAGVAVTARSGPEMIRPPGTAGLAGRSLREALDQFNEILSGQAEPTGLGEECLGIGGEHPALGLTDDGHAASSAELEYAFVPEVPEGTQHRIRMDAQDDCHVLRRR